MRSAASRQHVAQSGRSLGPPCSQHIDGFQRPHDIPARHHIGERVVVHILVILIRPDHMANMSHAISLSDRTRRPEARGLKENLRSGIEEECVIACGVPVLPHRIRKVGADVYLYGPEQTGSAKRSNPAPDFGAIRHRRTL
jgi:hypothetical protein